MAAIVVPCEDKQRSWHSARVRGADATSPPTTFFNLCSSSSGLRARPRSFARYLVSFPM